MMKWLIGLAASPIARLVVPRIVAALLAGLTGALLDAGLMDGAVGRAVLAALSVS